MSVIDNIVNELDSFISKYKTQKTELNERKEEDIKITKAIKEKHSDAQLDTYKDFEQAILAIPLESNSNADELTGKINDFQKAAKKNCLFVNESEEPSSLIDLSGIATESTSSGVKFYSLYRTGDITPVDVPKEVKYEIFKNTSNVSLLAGRFPVANIIKQYVWTVNVTEYDILKDTPVSFKMTQNGKVVVARTTLPKANLPTNKDVLKFTQLIPYKNNYDINQNVKYDNGSSALIKDETFGVKVESSKYNNVKGVQPRFVIQYNQFYGGSMSKCILTHKQTDGNTESFIANVHWNGKQSSLYSAIDNTNSSIAANYVFLRLATISGEDELQIVCGSTTGRYSFNITTDENTQGINAIKDLIKNGQGEEWEITLLPTSFNNTPNNLLLKYAKDL